MTNPDASVDTTHSLLHLKEAETERYRERVEQLFRIAKAQASEIASERRKRARAERRLQQSRDRLRRARDRSRSDIDELWGAKIALERDRRMRAEQRLDACRLQLHETEEKLDRAHRTKWLSEVFDTPPSAEQELEAERQERLKAEKATQRLQLQLKEKEAEIKQLRREKRTLLTFNKPLASQKVVEEQAMRRTAQKEAKNAKRKLRHVSRALNSLRHEHSRCGKRTSVHTLNGSIDPHQLFSALLSNITLVRDSAAHLSDSPASKQIFDDLQKLNDQPQSVRGDRMGSAEPWIELRPNPTPTERIYYRPTKGKSRYIVLLGNKNSQDTDIDWLKRNRYKA